MWAILPQIVGPQRLTKAILVVDLSPVQGLTRALDPT